MFRFRRKAQARTNHLSRRKRPQLEILEGRVLPSVTIASTNNSGQGYAALSYNQSGGYVPPDTNGAAGPSNYVETVNQEIAIYSPKATGSSSTMTSLSNFWYTTGALPHADSGSGLSDPVATYNDQIGRFIVADQDVNFNTHVSRFDVAVSKSNAPSTLGTADWNFYSIVTTEANEDADYPGNFGYNHDATVFTLNMFGVSGTSGTNHVQVLSLNNSNLANGTLTAYHNDLNDFAVRPTTMHSSVAGDPMWLVTEHGDNKSIDVIKMSNVLSSSAAFAYTNLGVTSYSAVVNPLNPNGTAITNNLDSRIQKSAEWNNLLVATHAVSISGTQDVAQWYLVDLSSGTPVLKDQGRVSAGNNTYITFPSIDINSSGQIGMTYMKSGNDTSTDYMSMYVTGRNSSDAAGTMETSVVVPAGKGQANYKDFSSGGRAGDLSGINVDPSDGSFWAANEFANTQASANWGTAVANFTLSSPLPSTDMALSMTGPSSVTAGTNATYTLTLTNKGPNAAQSVVLSDTLPNGSTFVSMTRTAGSDSFTLTQSGGTAKETASGTIASGASDTFTLVVSAPTSLANGAAFNNSASVSAANPDPNSSNNSATVNGTVVNSSGGPNADVSVTISGPASGNEGDTLTYNITVKNAGPGTATGVNLRDTLGSLLQYQSATSSQGTFSCSGGVVTFSIGSIASGGTVTATVTATASEDGSTSNSASVSATSPDPNTANNSASVTTSLAEPSITVSDVGWVYGSYASNFQVATFTHANGVEPASAFTATIDWGDGTTSQGTITQSGSTYSVTGTHDYGYDWYWYISTSVTELTQAAIKVNPGDTPGGDVVRYVPKDHHKGAVFGPPHSGGGDSDAKVIAQESTSRPTDPPTLNLGSAVGLQASLTSQSNSALRAADTVFAQSSPRAADAVFALGSLPRNHAHSLGNWLNALWVLESGLNDIGA